MKHEALLLVGGWAFIADGCVGSLKDTPCSNADVQQWTCMHLPFSIVGVYYSAESV